MGVGPGRVVLQRMAVWTSGDSREFYAREGKRDSQILDARTGDSFSDVLG